MINYDLFYEKIIRVALYLLYLSIYPCRIMLEYKIEGCEYVHPPHTISTPLVFKNFLWKENVVLLLQGKYTIIDFSATYLSFLSFAEMILRISARCH